MKKFIKKVLGFILTPLIVLFLLLFLFDFYINNNSRIINYSFNDQIENKSYNLKRKLNDSINIIIAGDSRAERQVMPQIIKSITGINSLNIAVASGDLVSTVPVINTFDDSNVFIVSTSSWQINDGAIDPGYFSVKCFQQFSMYEKFRIFEFDITRFINMYSMIFKKSINLLVNANNLKNQYNEEVVEELGFLGIEDTLAVDESDILNLIDSHSWYKNINIEGSRYRVFKEQFKQLDKKNH